MVLHHHVVEYMSDCPHLLLMAYAEVKTNIINITTRPVQHFQMYTCFLFFEGYVDVGIQMDILMDLEMMSVLSHLVSTNLHVDLIVHW
jgi:hypothetical protein